MNEFSRQYKIACSEVNRARDIRNKAATELVNAANSEDFWRLFNLYRQYQASFKTALDFTTELEQLQVQFGEGWFDNE